MNFSKKIFIALSFSLTGLASASEPSKPTDEVTTISQQAVATTTNAVKNLQHHLARINTFSANFTQSTQDDAGNTLQRVEGFMQVAKPGKLRWKTEGIYEQLVVSDGASLWIYDADLEQVSIKNMSNKLADTPALLLGGDVSAIDNDFIITQASSQTQALFILQPKDSSQLFDSLELSFNTLDDSVPLTYMIIRDASGQITDIRFSNIKMNPVFKASTFTFKAPKGTDIIDGRHAQ